MMKDFIQKQIKQLFFMSKGFRNKLTVLKENKVAITAPDLKKIRTQDNMSEIMD